jgi:hypothetical protein
MLKTILPRPLSIFISFYYQVDKIFKQNSIMRTSVLVAFLAVSFTAVLAAPQHNRVSLHKIHSTNLKHIALPKIAVAPRNAVLTAVKTTDVAPRVEIGELLTLTIDALTQVRDAVALAKTDLSRVLDGSPVYDRALIIIWIAEDLVTSTLTAAFYEAFTSADIPPIMAVTAKATQTMINVAALAVQLLDGDGAPEHLDAVHDIVLQLRSDVQNAAAPILDLISPPESKAIAAEQTLAQNPGLHVTLPELIELIRVAIAEVNAAIDSAALSLENLLIGTHIIEDVLDLVRAAESDALRLIEETIVEALKTPIEELPGLLEGLVVRLQTLFTEAVAEIQILVGREAEELARELDAIVAQLAIDIATAIQPILDALNPPVPLKLFRVALISDVM